ncbi:hypothetical protein HPP92_026836 [Vanilla planifolia]|uniref:Scarecrow-like protein 18 n=1 Tax=Vanilla planifolia TaxID=51239 RepID=A0A835U729_VANPL|nr:hypothetical protein HPP92_026836 [Vanilla planifolia]
MPSIGSPQHSHPKEMLSSLKPQDHEDDDEEEEDPHQHKQQTQQSPTLRHLLLHCADQIHHADLPAARRAVSLLSAASSPSGDSAERIAHQFAIALSLRIDRTSILPSPFPATDLNDEAIQSSYLSLNQIAPFLRFAHLTANQAILEAVEGRRSIHILDFDTSYGVQWPPLLQAIADRSPPSDPPSIRITGTGSDPAVLRRTALRLHSFAASLHLPFHFHPLLVPPTASASTSPPSAALRLHPGETLAVNCVFFLHKLLKDDPTDGLRDARAFLLSVRGLNPEVVTVAERDASHGSPAFLRRFEAAVDHYTAVFESLEATLPPRSLERMTVERVWLGREIARVVAGDERHERWERWEELMRLSGFAAMPLSPFAVSQARLLLRLHYPAEGYQLKVLRGACFLGWHSKPLFSVSSWRCN